MPLTINVESTYFHEILRNKNVSHLFTHFYNDGNVHKIHALFG